MVIIAGIVRQHVEEAAFLYRARLALCDAPHVTLALLARHDDRISAHLDGMVTAREAVLPICDDVLARFPEDGAFPAATAIVRRRDCERLQSVARSVQALPSGCAALVAAIEWLEREHLEGTVVTFLRTDDSLLRSVGIMACALHGVDPGLASLVEDRCTVVRSTALRAAGELGWRELIGPCQQATADPDPVCRFWGARSAVLLGDRNRALDVLAGVGLPGSAQGARAFRLALQALPVERGHAILQHLAKESAQPRWVIEGSGVVGDAAYVPWLLSQMSNPTLARVAGEAVTTITGLDLSQGFEVPAPAAVEGGPTDNPTDDNVGLHPDKGLPWPDVRKIQAWWTATTGRFQPGRRFFMGAAVTREHCIDVLKSGYQRQRILAACYCCLLDPGTPLFNTSAPAWRQQRLLARMK